ncbi:N-acetylmuramic acid 6-phosphate etherase [Paenibacillus sp. 4624]|uniref:N-acetylmuramic acid 6-phosphate etherase n=1 Tax=Paenibacillus amylolyticus TaxID=1451 RepID=A0A5M9WVJ7_PAEAM|nr:N-acetylmuramic acid 6-phosphate etherase [Paenibacillus amylolyticus]KAA8785674.1 N-acetylmuramic acid 6-phosphate etherase [Paenibacillus amylolyticus]
MNHTLNSLVTEQPNPQTDDMDQLPSAEIMELINREDRRIAELIQPLIPVIAQAADRIVASFQSGGRLFYVGAGTSGRLGILDASECPPTYGTPPSMVQGIIAGGFRAIKDPVEGAEDSEEAGETDLKQHELRVNDVVVGIAASGRTPYVLGAMNYARQLGAVVIGVSNNADTPMSILSDVSIEAVMGPEVVMGSTRMKAGTAQKMILNMLTTTAMIRLGKVYRNFMVDLNPSNEKLVHRAKRMIQLATGAQENEIEQAFTAANGHVKTAIVMLMADVDAAEAGRRLENADGFVRHAIAGSG